MENQHLFIEDELQQFFGPLNIPKADDLKTIDYASIIAAKIDFLIANDFNGLLFILYRLDVDEVKVKEMIASTGGITPGLTIANLILKRLEQKIYWRNKFKNQDKTEIDDEERW